MAGSLTARTASPRIAFSSRRLDSSRIVVRAEPPAAAPKPPAAKTEERSLPREAPINAVAEPPPPAWSPPTLDPDTPSPIFGGSTGGLLRKAQVEEFYVITWEAKKETIFEMPTGGAAIMRKGPNLLKLARKEQCLALETQLRSKFKLTPCFYRVFPETAQVQYLHPADGVYPEKVNPGRQPVNCNMRKIGDNVNPIKTKFTGKGPAEI